MSKEHRVWSAQPQAAGSPALGASMIWSRPDLLNNGQTQARQEMWEVFTFITFFRSYSLRLFGSERVAALVTEWD
jgi:hypothetical protein